MSKKLSKEELEGIQSLNKEFQTIKGQIGELELQKFGLLSRVEEIKEIFTGLEGGLVEKYGKDSVVDLRTGDVTDKK